MGRHFSYLIRFCLLSAVGLSILGAPQDVANSLYLAREESERRVEITPWLDWDMVCPVVATRGKELFCRKTPLHIDHNYRFFGRSPLTPASVQEKGERLTDFYVLPFKLLPRPPPYFLSSVSVII